MKNTLIDAGPLISLFDRDDRFHKPVIDFLQKFQGSLITTWPVVTETTHMLDFNIYVQLDFLKWIKRGAMQLVNLDYEDLERLIELTQRYANVPMDLADASLIVIAERMDIRHIVTIDSDFTIYRTENKEYLRNLLTPFIEVM
jgi:predicted nucleic acid-binding protein